MQPRDAQLDTLNTQTPRKKIYSIRSKGNGRSATEGQTGNGHCGHRASASSFDRPPLCRATCIRTDPHNDHALTLDDDHSGLIGLAFLVGSHGDGGMIAPDIGVIPDRLNQRVWRPFLDLAARAMAEAGGVSQGRQFEASEETRAAYHQGLRRIWLPNLRGSPLPRRSAPGSRIQAILRTRQIAKTVAVRRQNLLILVARIRAMLNAA